MRGISSVIAVLLLTGCTTLPERDNPWLSIEPARIGAQMPVPLPKRPQAIVLGDHAGFDEDGMRALAAYRVAAEANTEIAAENAQALDDMARAYNALADAGRAEFALSAINARRLAEERRARLWDKVQWLGLIGAAVIVGVAR